HVGSIDPSSGQIAVYPIAGTATYGVTAGPDGKMWFTEATTYRNPDGTINLMYSEIGTIDPTTHMVTEFEIPTGAAEPLGIAVGPEGNIWFTENGNSA